MNTVDGRCKLCNKPIRILNGTPAICADCSRTRASKMFCIALVVLLLLTLLDTLLSGCASQRPQSQKRSGQPPQQQEQPILAPPQQLTVQACLDITGSYPYADFKKAEQKIADATELSVQFNTRLVVYASLITSNSWQDDSTFFTERLDPISEPPPPVASTPPTPTGNLFVDKQKARQVAQENQARVAAYQQALRTAQAHLDQLRQQVHNQVNFLRSYSPAQTTQGTDEFGCLERSAGRLHMQTGQGNRILLVASDLQNNLTTEETGTLDLSGIRVVVIYHYCQDASSCQQARTWFTGIVQHAHAASTHFYDVSQSDLLENVFTA